MWQCRFDCAFQIGDPEPNKIHKLSRIHIDIGFSDRLPNKPSSEAMPSLIIHEAPVSWKVYPMEYIVAEKLQTLFDRGSANSRAKDVYDLIYLIPKCRDDIALSARSKKHFSIETQNFQIHFQIAPMNLIEQYWLLAGPV